MSDTTANEGSVLDPPLRGRRAVTAHIDVRMPAPGGVRLATDVYLPAGRVPCPAVLQRTPYGRGAGVVTTDMIEHTANGYALVSQDVRGRGDSTGTFTPFFDEAADGAAAVRWVAEQPWCTGEVFMVGPSYVGATQWLAAAERPAGLRAFSPQISTASYYDGWAYRGGAFEFGFMALWALDFLGIPALAAATARGETDQKQLARAIDASSRIGDFYTDPALRAEVLDDVAPYFADWVAHPTDDDFWRPIEVADRFEDVDAPALVIGGWFDCFLPGTLRSFTGMRARSGPAGAHTQLIIGPWAHGPAAGVFAERSFGPMASSAAARVTARQSRFFDSHRRGASPVAAAPVTVFVMGANEWRELDGWPPPGAERVDLHLHSAGDAATAGGALDPLAPEDQPADVYVHDPRHPVPTVGGQTFLPGLTVAANAGPRDQRPIESRPDVLSYTTAALDGAIEIIGPVELVLYAASSALDTDFVARLVDVEPSGRALVITEGVLRARYRDSLSEPTPLAPDHVYEMRVDMGATAIVFPAGHRIRLDVASSSFPRYDVNTGVISPADGDIPVAVNRIFHDRSRPSRLSLWVTGGRLSRRSA